MGTVKFGGITPYLHYEDAAASLEWLARVFGSLSHVKLSGNSPAKTLSAPKTTEQNAM